MLNKETKFDLNDILIQPASISFIDSRKQINPKDENNMLPIFAAPMDTVIDDDNKQFFLNNSIYCALPRNKNKNIYSTDFRVFHSYGLLEFEEHYIKNITYKGEEKVYALIDIANGNMKKLFDLVELSKQIWKDKLVLMAGNVANPQTYLQLSKLGLDYCRISVGSGSACTTSANVAIGYPLGSLIHECYQLSCTFNNPAKIVADGGMKNYSDLIKAYSLGADYIMLGGLFNQALESCGKTYKKEEINVATGRSIRRDLVDLELDQYSPKTKELFESGEKIYKEFRGMSTKEVQKDWNKEKLTTSEGISKINEVKYTINGWSENFIDYLKSAMSYTNKSELKDFIGNVEINLITKNAYDRFNK